MVFNNAGGNIFRLIDGPSAQPELEQYFETRHTTTAKHAAEDAGLGYYSLKEGEDFQAVWQEFIIQNDQAKLLEIFTDPVQNGEVFEAYRKTATT